jgi:alpha-beta hydrolase superfamily lysophospholipase
MKIYRYTSAAGWVFFITTLCSLLLPARVTAEPFEKRLDRLKNNIPALDLNSPPQPSPEAVSYFQYYGIDYEDAAHYFGYFKSRDYKIVTHILMPAASRGTVFLLHGYLDHTGLLKNIIHLLLSMGFAVATYDLPGHGLSSGERVAIDDFSEYASVFNDFITLFAPRLPTPLHLIGHSTGCAIAYEYLHQHTVHPFDRIIFLAPLVHSNHWRLSKAGHWLTDPFIDKIPRTFKENTSDGNYLAFLAGDPLQSRHIPLKWITAMYAWEEKIHDYPGIDQPLCIIQGQDDSVVDWRYNISFLKDKIGPVNIKLIPEAKHQLINERVDLRLKIFHEIRICLEKGKERSP